MDIKYPEVEYRRARKILNPIPKDLGEKDDDVSHLQILDASLGLVKRVRKHKS